MPSYEMLDAIADAYIPLLAAMVLLLVVVRLFMARWKAAAVGLAGFAVVAVVAYGLMFIDNALAIWPGFGLDYSTHTATALGLVMLLSLEQRQLSPLWFGSLLCYVLLMLYQRYHSMADIVTTALVVAMPLGAVMWLLYLRRRTAAV